MAVNLLPMSQQQFDAADGSKLLVSIVNVTSSGDTFDVDASVFGTPVSFHLGGGTAPTITVAAAHASTAGNCRVTLSSGTNGKVMVISRHIGNASALGSALRA